MARIGPEIEWIQKILKIEFHDFFFRPIFHFAILITGFPVLQTAWKKLFAFESYVSSNISGISLFTRFQVIFSRNLEKITKSHQNRSFFALPCPFELKIGR